MRTVRQPGPAPAERAVVVPVRSLSLDVELAAGRPLLEALHDAVEGIGGEAACLRLAGGRLDPVAYVMPALAPDATHAAYYSETFRPVGGLGLETAAVTVGWRDDTPFFHAHGIWTEADGKRRGGHLLPEEALIAAPIRATGVAIVGGRFEVLHDPETNFRLFTPVATAPTDASVGEAAIAIRLRPNQDITTALEAIARAAGFAGAVLAGGVGSIVGARYVDAAPVEPFATEMLVCAGRIAGAADASAPTRLDVALVDLTGAVSAGHLVNGDNPILMTLETVLLSSAG